MTTGASAATNAASSAAVAIAQAIKASGVLIKLEAKEFQKVLNKQDNPLIVSSVSSFFSKTYKYMNSYKGLTFYCESKQELILPSKYELVVSEKIWIPG